MVELSTLVEKVRSKNAGPFWLTVDIFCGDMARFDQISAMLKTTDVAALFNVESATLKRFDIPSLFVVKFSLPRPTIQGSREDRDMHGAQWGALLAEMDI